jgi:hypothetical protein
MRFAPNSRNIISTYQRIKEYKKQLKGLENEE